MPSFDVHQETGIMVQTTVQSAYSGLLQFKPAEPEKILGDLAEKWEVSPDGTVYTFHLLKGVKFHDGSTLTSEDVRYSVQRIIDPPRNIISTRRSTLAAIKEVTAPDPDTVTITLKYAQGSFLPMLAVGMIVVYPKKVVEAKGDMKTDIVGTGPFMYKDYSLGSFFEAKRNPNYFVKGLPYLDGLRFYVIRDDSTRLAAFRSGRVNLVDPTRADGLRPTQVQTIRKDMPEAVIVKYPALSSRWLDMVVTIPPFNDVRVRQAVSLAIDRQAAIKLLASGEADIGGVFVSGSDWATPEAELLKTPGYRQPKDADIAEAKRLLAEAGFPRGFKASILARASFSDDMAVLMKEQLARVGIQLELVVQDTTLFLTQLSKMAYPLVARPTALSLSDPDELSRYLVSTGGTNRLGFKNQEVDALFDKRSRAMDVSERRKIVRELEMKLIELAPVVVMFWQRGNVAHSPDLKNYFRGSIYNSNKYQDVWLAK
ncbi:MAG: ABC transporter substrate-binding protein [Chloroflexi bacterium]|nr:ABC transporter substrate-binding protein [Chloroflexota bacterium]